MKKSLPFAMQFARNKRQYISQERGLRIAQLTIPLEPHGFPFVLGVSGVLYRETDPIGTIVSKRQEIKTVDVTRAYRYC